MSNDRASASPNAGPNGRPPLDSGTVQEPIDHRDPRRQRYDLKAVMQSDARIQSPFRIINTPPDGSSRRIRLHPCSSAALAALFCAIFVPVAVRAKNLDATVAWVGNSYSGKARWVQQDISGLCVTSDGTVFTNTFWDEGGGNVAEYRDGDLIRTAGHTHGWGYEGGDAIAANSRYLFIVQNVDSEGGHLQGNSWPPKGFTWSGISRRRRSDIQVGAPFAGGHGQEGDVLPRSFLPVEQIPDGEHGSIRGVAATDRALYVSSPFENQVREYDPETMALRHAWKVERPDRLALDRSGHVWVLQIPARHEAWHILPFSADGDPLSPGLTLPAGVIPSAITFDSKNRLIVSDDGPRQQIEIYSVRGAPPGLVGTFGDRGGILGSARGRFGDRRFNHPTGVGIDAAGNLTVASDGSVAGGGTVLERYGPDGTLRWRRSGLTFVDLGDADPGNLEDVYTKEEHFRINPAAPTGSNWSYQGYTVDRFRYPQDPRLHTAPTNALVVRLHGHPFLFVSDMTAEYLSVYRFHPSTDGEIAIPQALFARHHVSGMGDYPSGQPPHGEWVWQDQNFDGAMQPGEFESNGGAESQGVLVPDEQGTLWQVNDSGIRALPISRWDSNGAPHWSYRQARVYQKPKELDEIRRLMYFPDRDQMLLGGNRGPDRNQHWKPMGPVLCRYDHWSSGHPTLRALKVLPYEKGSAGHESIEPISFSVAGEYVFVAYTRGLPAEGLQNAFVRVLRRDDLSFVGNLSAEAQVGETGLLDLVESTRARRTPDGAYLVFLEDDEKAKILLFRWKPAPEKPPSRNEK